MKNLKKNLKLIIVILFAFGLLFPMAQPALAQPACGNTYTVQSGDTLQIIANRCGVTAQSILDLNPFITNPSQIYVGWVLTIREATLDSVIIPNTGAPTVSSVFYIVKPGDNLPYIAKRLKVSEDDLLKLNPQIKRDEPLSTSEILRIPTTFKNPAAIVSPRVIEPGQTIALQAANFPANTQLMIAGGPLGERGRLLKYAQSDGSGNLFTNVQIPSTAQRDNRWVLVIRATQMQAADAVTNLIYIVNTNGPEESIVYIVRINDTMSTIATQFGVTIEEILDANPQIENPRVIRVNQKILIPGRVLRETGKTDGSVLLIEPNSGQPGTQVEIYAKGLPANMPVDIEVSPISDPGLILATTRIRSSARGTLNTQVTIPSTISTNQVLIITADPAEDGDITPPTQFFYVGETRIPVTGGGGQSLTTSVQLSPAYGPPGANVQLMGTGFPANILLQVQVASPNRQPNYSLQIRTNRDGQVQAALRMPDATPSAGYYLVTVVPMQTGVGMAYQAVYTVLQASGPVTGGDKVYNPSVSLYPSAGTAGTVFTLVLTDMPANTGFTLQVNAPQQQASRVIDYTTGTDGNFTARIMIPQSAKPGDIYSVMVAPFDTSLPVRLAFFTVTN